MAEGHKQKGRKPTGWECISIRNAIENNEIDTIEKMIRQDGIDVDAIISIDQYYDFGDQTAVQYAVNFDKLECVRLLVKLGADITLLDRDINPETKKLPIQRAVDSNCASIVYFFAKECNQDISKLDQDYQDKIHRMVQVYKKKGKKEHLHKSLSDS